MEILLQAVGAINFGGPDAAKAGLALGTATSAGLLALYAKRTLDTGKPSEHALPFIDSVSIFSALYAREVLYLLLGA